VILLAGEQRLLRVPGLTRYSLGGDAARAHPAPGDPEALLLKGVRPGGGDLWTWNRTGGVERRTIEVQALAASPGPAGLGAALSRLQEVEVYRAGALAVLRGTVRTYTEATRVAALAAAFPAAVRDETALDEALLRRGEEKLTDWLDHAGRPTLRLERVAGQLWLRGSLPNPGELDAVRAETRARFPLVRLEIETLPDGGPTIYFRVFLLELRKSRFGSFGLTWPDSAQAFQVTTGAIRDVLGLDVAIRTLEGEGSARVLSKPELAVRAPGEAELFAGGELPIRTKTHFSSNVQWKSYGLTLRLKVTGVAGDRVRLEIMTEVSHLDPAAAADDVPGLQANRLRTQVDARYGTPLLLSGLLQQGLREQARGLPLLRRLPVLGSLFGSEDYLNERSELVAILVPQSAPPRTSSPPVPDSLLTRAPAPAAEAQAADRGRTEAEPAGPIAPRRGLPPAGRRAGHHEGKAFL
jgi:hypothetical protein